MEMLQLNDLHKTFNPGTVNEKVALNGVSLHMEAGDFATIVGSNGAGKSTLFNAITGGFIADEGSIVLGGQDITFEPEHQRSKVIGHLFQDPLKGTAPNMTIEENLALAYLRAGTAPHAIFSRISRKDKELFREKLSLLDMGLEDRMKQPVGLLSGGQRQALTLLMATLVTPKLLLLDEHTAALDPATAEKVLELTRNIVAEKKITCLMVTHNMHQALELGNRTLMMDAGRIVFDVQGEERSRMTVDDLLEKFRENAGKALDNDLTQTLLDMVTNLNLSECVDYNASDLSLYGLDAPAVTATVLDGGKAAYTLEISASEGGECYVRLSGSKMIYQRDATLSDTLRYTTYADLQPDDVILMDWDTVQSVAVTVDGEKSVLTRTTEEKTDDEGTVTEETVWKLDGQEVKFAPVLNSLSGMTSSGYAIRHCANSGAVTPEGEPEITFRILRDRENFSEVTLCFYAYNSTSCLVTLDGVSTVTVKRETAAELVSSVEKLLK